MEGGHDSTVSPKRHHEGAPPLPPDVSSWYVATGSSLIANHPQTVTVPPFVFSWWEATGGPFFAKVNPKLPAVTTAGPTSSKTADPQDSGPTHIDPESPAKPSPSLPSQTDSETLEEPTNTRSPPFSTPAFPPPKSDTTTESSSTSTSTNITSISISLSTVPSDAASSTPTPSSNPINAASNKKTARIIAGVVVPLVLIFIGVAAFIIYKRRQRARDRREWERTHDAIADAVRRVGGTPAPGPPAWRPPYNDVKAPLEGDTAPLFEKSGDPSLPGPLEHTGGEFHSGPPSSLV